MILLAYIVFGLFVGVYGDDERSAGLRSSVFLEQPERVTVYESDNATFRCSVVNSSFSIFWLVNGFSATYTASRERGFSVKDDPDTHTISRLEVVGHACNNNTNISCAADQIHSDPQLSWIVSEVALLIVQDKETPQSAVEESMHLIVSTETELVVAKTTSSLQTKVIRTSAVPSASGTPDNTPDLKLLPGQASTKSDQKNMILFWYIGGIIGLIVLLILTFFVILIVSRKLMRKAEGARKAQVEDKELQSNPIYSCISDSDPIHSQSHAIYSSISDPIPLQRNQVYEYFRPVKCEKNCAYDSVNLHSAATTHH